MKDVRFYGTRVSQHPDAPKRRPPYRQPNPPMKGPKTAKMAKISAILHFFSQSPENPCIPVENMLYYSIVLYRQIKG